MLPLLCFLTGIGCASALPRPPVTEPDPGRPIVVQSAEQATAAEAERLHVQAEAARAESDALVKRRATEEREKRTADLEAYKKRIVGTRIVFDAQPPSQPQPRGRNCRTVVATEVRGRVYTVRQADGTHTVEAEPVPGEVLPLEICDPVPGPGQSSK